MRKSKEQSQQNRPAGSAGYVCTVEASEAVLLNLCFIELPAVLPGISWTQRFQRLAAPIGEAETNEV